MGKKMKSKKVKRIINKEMEASGKWLSEETADIKKREKELVKKLRNNLSNMEDIDYNNDEMARKLRISVALVFKDEPSKLIPIDKSKIKYIHPTEEVMEKRSKNLRIKRYNKDKNMEKKVKRIMFSSSFPDIYQSVKYIIQRKNREKQLVKYFIDKFRSLFPKENPEDVICLLDGEPSKFISIDKSKIKYIQPTEEGMEKRSEKSNEAKK